MRSLEEQEEETVTRLGRVGYGRGERGVGKGDGLRQEPWRLPGGIEVRGDGKGMGDGRAEKERPQDYVERKCGGSVEARRCEN